jgi:hypothetical protein
MATGYRNGPHPCLPSPCHAPIDYCPDEMAGNCRVTPASIILQDFLYPIFVRYMRNMGSMGAG